MNMGMSELYWVIIFFFLMILKYLNMKRGVNVSIIRKLRIENVLLNIVLKGMSLGFIL